MHTYTCACAYVHTCYAHTLNTHVHTFIPVCVQVANSTERSVRESEYKVLRVFQSDEVCWRGGSTGGCCESDQYCVALLVLLLPSAQQWMCMTHISAVCVSVWWVLMKGMLHVIFHAIMTRCVCAIAYVYKVCLIYAMYLVYPCTTRLTTNIILWS